MLSRATSVEADQRLNRFGPFARPESKPNNKIVKLNAITIGTIIAPRSYSCVNCFATARWWDFMIPPSRQRFKSLRPSLSHEFSRYRSYVKRISTLQWNQQGTCGFAPKQCRISRMLLAAETSLRGYELIDPAKVNSLAKSQLFVI